MTSCSIASVSRVLIGSRALLSLNVPVLPLPDRSEPPHDEDAHSGLFASCLLLLPLQSSSCRTCCVCGTRCSPTRSALRTSTTPAAPCSCEYQPHCCFCRLACSLLLLSCRRCLLIPLCGLRACYVQATARTAARVGVRRDSALAAGTVFAGCCAASIRPSASLRPTPRAAASRHGPTGQPSLVRCVHPHSHLAIRRIRPL